jgi:hypothetical protein
MTPERRATSDTSRTPFAALGRAAIQKQVPESRATESVWHERLNSVTVRWPEADGFVYIGIHRHLNWIAGETGWSRHPAELQDLRPLHHIGVGSDRGWRIGLGELLEGENRWWRAGSNETTLCERLDWIALQLRVRGAAYLRRRGAETRRERAG